MDEAAIAEYITHAFAGVNVEIPSSDSGAPEIAWGDRFFSYEPERASATRGWLPFATIVTKDYGDFDNASQLNRPEVFRLNIGVSAQTFRALFGDPASSAEEATATPHWDFTTFDRVMPHPVYARQHWVCVLNPSNTTFATTVRPLLADAYALAVDRYSRRADRP